MDFCGIVFPDQAPETATKAKAFGLNRAETKTYGSLF